MKKEVMRVNYDVKIQRKYVIITGKNCQIYDLVTHNGVGGSLEYVCICVNAWMSMFACVWCIYLCE